LGEHAGAGYYSADLHVHFGYDRLAVLEQLSLADDVHIVPAFTFWLRGTEPEWKAEWPAWRAGRGPNRRNSFCELRQSRD